MKKKLLYVLIPVLTVLLMSHNVSALDFTVDYNSYTRINIPENPNITCVSNSGTNTNVASCDIPGSSSNYNIQVNQIYAYQGLQNIKQGDLIEFYLKINNTSNNYLDGGSLNIQNFSLYYGSYYSIVGVEEVIGDDLIDIISHSEANNIDILRYLDVYNKNRSYKVFRVVLRVTQDTPAGVIAQYGLYHSNGIFKYQSLNSDSVVNISIFGSKLLRYTGTEENKEVEQKTQDAADNSANVGNSSQSSSQGATSNLLSVFTGFANVITNASATNCVINAPLNTNFSNDNFNVDLCGLDLPPAIGALTSIIAVMVVVPFAISMFNKFIGIMESFQK